MSFSKSAVHAAKKAVRAPRVATVPSTAGASKNNSWVRAIKYTPAVTMVAACSKALTGVGPAIASGNQVCSGSWADLPSAPTSNSALTMVAVELPRGQERKASAAISSNCRVPSSNAMNKMAIIRLASPIRVMMNAFRAAAPLAGSWYQKPMRR